MRPPDQRRWRGKEKGPAQALSQGARRQRGGGGVNTNDAGPGTGAAAGEPGRLRPLPATLGHPEPLTRVCPELRGSLLSGGRTALGDEPGNTDG